MGSEAYACHSPVWAVGSIWYVNESTQAPHLSTEWFRMPGIYHRYPFCERVFEVDASSETIVATNRLASRGSNHYSMLLGESNAR